VTNLLTSCVLYVEPMSMSLAYRSHRDKVGSQTVLQWWAERVLGMAGVGHLYVVVHTDAERDEVAQQLAGHRVRVFRTQYYNERRALAELARSLDERVLALMRLGCALAPDDLLERVATHHGDHGNNFTTVWGLPGGGAPGPAGARGGSGQSARPGVPDHRRRVPVGSSHAALRCGKGVHQCR
jgi:hypothetical protein